MVKLYLLNTDLGENNNMAYTYSNTPVLSRIQIGG